MDEKNILEVNIIKTINVSQDVVRWNYWDHEHLDNVHSGYKRSDILYEKANYVLRIDQVKIPLIPFLTAQTPLFMVQHSREVSYTFAVQFGVVSKTTITVKEINSNECRVTMNYKFYLNGWRRILRPILKRLIPKWNEKIWLEDLPIKLRRQLVRNIGFKDFYGLPKDIKDRIKTEGNEVSLPLPRIKDSNRDKHPLKNIKK